MKFCSDAGQRVVSFWLRLYVTIAAVYDVYAKLLIKRAGVKYMELVRVGSSLPRVPTHPSKYLGFFFS